MDLKTYIKSEGMTQEDFARKVGVTLNTICGICNKTKSPSLEVAHFIVLASRGKVDYQDLICGRNKRNG